MPPSNVSDYIAPFGASIVIGNPRGPAGTTTERTTSEAKLSSLCFISTNTTLPWLLLIIVVSHNFNCILVAITGDQYIAPNNRLNIDGLATVVTFTKGKKGKIVV